VSCGSDFFVVLRFEFRVSYLLDKVLYPLSHGSQSFLLSSFFSDKVSHFLLAAGLGPWSSYSCLLCS
jgi:hypothetical protein